MSLGLMALAAFFTWFSSKNKNILLTFVTSLMWLGLAMWFFFATTPLMDLNELYAQMFAWAFCLLATLPWLMHMDYEIWREAKGHKWIDHSSRPRDVTPSSWEKWNEKVQRRYFGRK